METSINIMRLDIATQRLETELNKNNEITDFEYYKLLNTFDRFQELMRNIKIKETNTKFIK